MSFVSTLLAPLLLLFPGGAADKAVREEPAAESLLIRPRIDVAREEGWNQVRIEQRMTIRITPHAAPMPSMLFDLPDREVGPRFIERKMGKCLAVSGIAGVQSGGGSRLILFMRDRRIVSANLERACRARDFYSGFYLARSEDGQLCVDRDALQSRNGANCRLTKFRQLIEVGG